MKKGKNHRTIFIVLIVLGVIVLASVLFYAISEKIGKKSITGNALSKSTTFTTTLKTTKVPMTTTTLQKICWNNYNSESTTQLKRSCK